MSVNYAIYTATTFALAATSVPIATKKRAYRVVPIIRNYAVFAAVVAATSALNAKGSAMIFAVQLARTAIHHTV